jgi:hypothetical protein
MYLTYDEYLDMGGAEIEEEVFNRHIARANATITRMTHGRILNESPVRESVKCAAFELANAIHADSQVGAVGREIASMSNDGVGVSFVTGSQSGAAASAHRHAAIVREYLEFERDANGTLLLYVGVDA